MDTAFTLVRIYLFICRRYRGRLAAAAQRQSNNSDPDFTDEEVLTIYVFGLIKKRTTISEIHEYVEDHFSDWFPDLPSYQSYNRRLNRLSAVFFSASPRSPLGSWLQKDLWRDGSHRRFDADHAGEGAAGFPGNGGF
ncbi:hypothetical protein GGP67_001103 [Salinibacter ruber]|nr:hypothetical protein [Salinibacter ruber]MCS3643571.1 hypothetical protein [Salinibacter ruber]